MGTALEDDGATGDCDKMDEWNKNKHGQEIEGKNTSPEHQYMARSGAVQCPCFPVEYPSKLKVVLAVV